MILSVGTLRKAAQASAIAAAIILSPALSAIAEALELNGAGATFPVPLYERYWVEMRNAHPELEVNYQGIGSGGGIRQLIEETVDFAGSDAAMTDAQIEQVGRGVVLVPTAGGAVSIVYNLPGVSNLRLPRSVYPAIFTGEITRWNDPRIVSANPGVRLPDLPIRPVVRADSSGTTFIFTNHLSAVSSAFRGLVGAGTAPTWTINPIQGNGNPGVAAEVGRTRGGIGYVEFAYAKQNNLSAAILENGSGEFVAPSLEATEQALSTLEFPDDFRTFVDDPASGYPIAGLTWLMVYREYPDAATADAVQTMIEWILTDGQDINNDLDYTRIPEAVTQRAIRTVQQNVAAQ